MNSSDLYTLLNIVSITLFTIKNPFLIQSLIEIDKTLWESLITNNF
jgi:hypothetical protein